MLDSVAAMLVTLWLIALFSTPPIGDWVHLLLLAAVVIGLRKSFGSSRNEEHIRGPLNTDQDLQ